MKIKVKAKLNLILRVMNKREDNYHNLEMINTKINLYDKISIKTNSTKDIIKYIYHPEYDTTANNLILKVLTAFKQKYNIKNGSFSKYLYNDLEPIDLLIRTSGELRISNFMLFQLAYSELYFTNTYFPDFKEKEFDIALEDYQKRIRRFGGV